MPSPALLAVRSAGAGPRPRPLAALLLVLAALAGPGARASRGQEAGDPAAVHAQLVQTLRCWDEAYRRGIPAVADAQYDALMERLRELEHRHPELASAGAAVPGAEGDGSLPHGAPMLSLDKLRGREELDAWYAEISARLGTPPSLRVEPKLDGVALELVYVEGRLTRALTRGDGQSGTDVTSLARHAAGVPPVLDTERPPRLLDVRGELVVSRGDLAAFNATQPGPPFPDGRSLAAGSLALRDEQARADRPLAFVAHGLGRAEGLEARDQGDAMGLLAAWGLAVVEGRPVPGGANEAWAEHERLLARRHALPVEADGSVVKVSDLPSQRILGATERAPHWARAIKFPATRSSTRVLAIEVGVGRTGALTPRALLESVVIDGVRVSAASLHGMASVARLGVKTGDTVLVERAGGVVPQVLAVLQDGGGARFEPPTNCPRCGSPVQDERCPNRRCPAVLARRLAHLASPAGLDVPGLGEALAEQLVEAGLIVELDDVFALDPAALEGLPGLGTRSAEKLLANLAACRHASWERLLVALGIEGIGPATAAALAQRFPSWELLLRAERDQLLAVPGVGPVAADALLSWRDEPAQRALVERLLARGLGRTGPGGSAGP